MSVAYHDNLRASRRLTGFLLFVIGVGLTVGLYYVKTRAQTARNEVRSLERQIAQEEAAIGVLRAEIAYLESPERLAELGQTELGLMATDSDRIVTPDAILDIPLREPELIEPEVEGASDE